MAKGNMLLGYSRGSVGSMVFSRVKGQQITKARNSKPANPKTKKQMQQRSSFISPVKFYTHGVQALFKFAFSDKKVTESDFNAFMRNNAKAAFPVTKAEIDNPDFPALGNYLMSKGKLAEFPVRLLSDSTNLVGVDIAFRDDPETVGELSQAFIDAGLVEEGDIVTFVSISQSVDSISATEIRVTKGVAPVWRLNQFVVDSSSTMSLVTALPDMIFTGVMGLRYMCPVAASSEIDKLLLSLAVVRSRETALGLEVSTSYLHNGGHIDDYIQFRNSKAQVDKVLADWGATGDAILQGSIAKK